MDFVPLLVLSALIKKLVDTVKYALAGDLNAVVTQLVVWLAGIGVTFVAAASDLGGQVMINGVSLHALNGWSLAIVGVNLASTAAVGWDVIKAVDNTNSAAVPDLLRNVTTATPHRPVP